jgi:hypothetical protein
MISMVQRPPPPPPPPPQRLPPTGQDRSTQTVFIEEGTSTVEIQANVHEASKLKIRSLNGEIIQILVHPDMSQGELSHSIAHAVLSPSEGSILVETWSGGTGIVDSSRIAVSVHRRNSISSFLTTLKKRSFFLNF